GRSEAPALAAALAAPDWHAREDTLVEAYEQVARAHNALGVTEAVDPTVRQFWGRPFRVLFADRFADALRAAISDQELRALRPGAEAIDAISDSTDFLTEPKLWRQLVGLYDRR